MTGRIEILKGIPPGKIIDRELKKRKVSQRSFARDIGEYSQNLNAVINGRRRLTTELALKIEEWLGLEEGFLLTLQAYSDIADYKREQARGSVSGKPNVHKGLFWDTDFDKLDFGVYKTAVIQRVLERGNQQEKDEIARFYGMEPAALGQYKPENSYKIRLNR